MMAFSLSLKVFSLVVLVAMANFSVHAISCQQAVTELMPCLPFLKGPAPSPIVPCCLAVKDVNDKASTTQDRRDLCECFKKAAPSFGVIPDKAKKLPQLCHVDVPVPIDPSIDCQSIQ